MSNTVVLKQDNEKPVFEVIIGMRNSAKVTATGSGGSSLNDVLNAAINELGLSSNEANIFDSQGKLKQTVFVDGQRVSSLDTIVNSGAKIHVDQRKENG